MKRMTKIGMIASLAIMMVYGFAITSMAADCSKAEVYRVGFAPGYGDAGTDGLRVGLINRSGKAVGSWSNNETRYFYLTSALGDEGYATMLTALSLDKPVWIRITGNADVNSLISIVHLTK